jgi:hypothetical protein
MRDAAGSSSAPPRRKKKKEPEEWEQIPPELFEETQPSWVEHREMLARLFRHASGQTLAVVHSLAAAGGAGGVRPHQQSTRTSRRR